MKMSYSKKHNLNLIHEEILESFPEWRGVLNSKGIYENPLLYIQGNGNVLFLTVPDDADMNRLHSIVNQHDDTKLSSGDKEKKEKEDSKHEYDKDQFKDISDLESVVDREFSTFTNKQKDFLKKLGRLSYYIGKLEVKKEY